MGQNKSFGQFRIVAVPHREAAPVSRATTANKNETQKMKGLILC